MSLYDKLKILGVASTFLFLSSCDYNDFFNNKSNAQQNQTNQNQTQTEMQSETTQKEVKIKDDRTEKIAKIKIIGAIDDLSLDSYLELIDKAEKDKVDGYLFEINSPGGTVYACKQLATRIKNLKGYKVAMIKAVGASGAYWVASATDEIVADETSLVGSIGVIYRIVVVQKPGVNVYEFHQGRLKSMGTSSRHPTEEEKNKFQALVDESYEMFIRSVSDNRGTNNAGEKKLPLERLREIATGEIYSGSGALTNGLVDHLSVKSLTEDATKTVLKQRFGDHEIKDYNSLGWSIGKVLGKVYMVYIYGQPDSTLEGLLAIDESLYNEN